MLKRTALHGYALFNKSLGGAEVKKMVFQMQKYSSGSVGLRKF
jgi:hypothetical protein